MKLNPEPCGAVTITKNEPLSSGAINAFLVKLKKNQKELLARCDDNLACHLTSEKLDHGLL